MEKGVFFLQTKKCITASDLCSLLMTEEGQRTSDHPMPLDMTKHTIRGMKEHRNQQEINVTPPYNIYTTALSIVRFLAFSRSCQMSLQKKTHHIEASLFKKNNPYDIIIHLPVAPLGELGGRPTTYVGSYVWGHQ